MSIQKANQDQTVELVGPKDAEDALAHLRGGSESFGGVAQAVLKFVQVGGYTTFRAEHTRVDDNIVVHFFRPEKASDAYWLDKFADGLNTVAQGHFAAAYPRLAAKFTEDDGAGNKLDSWWFKARGYDHILDVDAYMGKFYDKLDAFMDPHLPGSG